ncbi:MAG: flavodoxin domain-containing protein [Gemmatimonadota bacterium]
MSRLLIVYDTQYGQTQLIALKIMELLAAAGHRTRLDRIDRRSARLNFDPYDAVVVAAPVFYGHHRRVVREFARQHRDELNARPTALISVCGSTGSRAQGYIDALVQTSGWRPGMAQSVSGGVAYTKFNPILRWWMKRMAQARGLSVDTSKDSEFTDWSQVRRLAAEIARMVPGGSPARASVTEYAEGTV